MFHTGQSTASAHHMAPDLVNSDIAERPSTKYLKSIASQPWIVLILGQLPAANLVWLIVTTRWGQWATCRCLGNTETIARLNARMQGTEPDSGQTAERPAGRRGS